MLYSYLCIYMCWLLNNTSLNYTGPLTHGFFSINKYYCATGSMVGWICGCGGTVGYGALTVKLHLDFWLRGGVAAPNPHLFQGSTVHTHTHTHTHTHHSLSLERCLGLRKYLSH